MKNAEGNQDLWRYTRLGKIVDKSASELTELLGSGDAAVTLTME